MKPTEDTSDKNKKQETLLSHLYELRSRLLWVVGSVLVVFIGLFPFANKLYSYLAGPLMAHLPEGSSMVAIDVASPFLTPFKLVFLVSIVLAIPIIFYHAWAFIAPGLYSNEKRLVFPLLVSSSLLFYVGMAFAYFIVFPLMFGFFTKVAPEGVAVMTDIGRYLDFVVKIFIAFGIAFEVPIVTLVLVKLGITTPNQLAGKRPYVIVGAFILGMLLTPPDIISQILLAIPVWLLFELGLALSRVMVSNKNSNNETDTNREEATKQEPRFAPLTAEEQEMEQDDNELLDDPDSAVDDPNTKAP
jgi:sec-independent protein translocase protein TatC